jgi:hypothetical protein
MKNNKLMKFMMFSALLSTASLKSIDVNVAIKGVTDVKANVDRLSESFNQADKSLDDAKKALNNKNMPAKERAQIAAQALVNGIETINNFFGSINTLNTALIGAQIPLASDALNKQLKPRLTELIATANAMQAALKTVLDLVKPTAASAAVTVAPKPAPVLETPKPSAALAAPTMPVNVIKPMYPEPVSLQKTGKVSAVPAEVGEPEVVTEEFNIPDQRPRGGTVVNPQRPTNSQAPTNVRGIPYPIFRK